jgi:hypothetical protein
MTLHRLCNSMKAGRTGPWLGRRSLPWSAVEEGRKALQAPPATRKSAVRCATALAIVLVASASCGWLVLPGLVKRSELRSADQWLRQQQREPQEHECGFWWAANRLSLSGSCMGAVAAGTSQFPCCQQTGCKPCNAEIFGHLQCVSPRHMLLRPRAGCSSMLVPPPLPPVLPRRPLGQQPNAGQGGSRMLPLAALLNGTWAPSGNETMLPPPGVPPLLFHPAANASSGGAAPTARPPLTALEAYRCFYKAGFNRVVISGDSSVRHLFNRLVR